MWIIRQERPTAGKARFRPRPCWAHLLWHWPCALAFALLLPCCCAGCSFCCFFPQPLLFSWAVQSIGNLWLLIGVGPWTATRVLVPATVVTVAKVLQLRFWRVPHISLHLSAALQLSVLRCTKANPLTLATMPPQVLRLRCLPSRPLPPPSPSL